MMACFLRKIRGKSGINLFSDWPESKYPSPSAKETEMTMTPSDPSQWNRVNALPFDGERAGEPQVVPGIPAVRQQIRLYAGEWVCSGCRAGITGDDESTYIDHNAGCPTIAAIAKAAAG